MAFAVGLLPPANAGTVKSTGKNTRCMLTGCKFERSFSTGGSIGIWVKDITSHDANAVLFGGCHATQSLSGQGLILQIISDNFAFRVSGEKNGSVAHKTVTAANTSGLLNDGAWHFVLGTFDIVFAKMRLYIDGEEAGSADIDIDSLVPSLCFTAGSFGQADESDNPERDGTFAGFNGRMAEATLWDKALSASEVATLCTRRAMPEDDGLIGYWPMAKNNGNLARNAALRNNGSRPLAKNLNMSSVVDEDFFDDPPTHFVASEEWVAANNYVQPAGATFTTPDDPATNVADAVSAAAAGNIVYLVPGTHSITSQVDITKANLTITGRYCGNDVGEAVIDAHRLCRHFRSHYDHSGQDGFTIDGITFRNGLPSGSDVDDQRGGSLLVRNKSGTVCNCRFFGNESTYAGGAIWAQQGNGTVVSNCVFGGNICSGTGQGGAVYAHGSAISIVDCVITNNSAVQGGGVYAQEITIDGCRFEGNLVGSADDNRRGGNILVQTDAKVLNSTFTGTCSAKRGACLGFMGSGAIISNCVFSGLAPIGLYGVMQFNYTATQSTFADCVFTNMASNLQLFYPQNSSVSVLIRQCLFGENSGTAAVVSDSGGKLRFENCTILASVFDSGSTASENVLVNCIAPNADIVSNGTVNNILTNCLVKSVSGGTQDSGVMTGNPKFVDAENGDWHLMPGSPCREKGMMLDWMPDASDLDSNPRVVDRYGKQSAEALPDLGCYEILEPQYGFFLLIM